MKQAVTFSGFTDAFRSFGRFDQFGYDALRVLFEYLEQYEDDTGCAVDLDVIALCCQFSVDSVGSIAESYDIDLPEDATEEEAEEIVMAYLEDHTIVCGTTPTGDIVYSSEF